MIYTDNTYTDPLVQFTALEGCFKITILLNMHGMHLSRSTFWQNTHNENSVDIPFSVRANTVMSADYTPVLTNIL